MKEPGREIPWTWLNGVGPATEPERRFGDIRVYCGQGQLLRLLHRGALMASQHQRLNLLLEIGVEKAIDERIDTGGSHGA